MEGNDSKMSKVSWTNWSGSKSDGNNIMDNKLWLYSATSKGCPLEFWFIVAVSSFYVSSTSGEEIGKMTPNWQAHITNNACHIPWKELQEKYICMMNPLL
jgi:hypothetical protein